MTRIGRNISIILRAERMIAGRHMAVLRNQTGFLAFAALVGVMGLVMLNIAAFYWLVSFWSPSAAALIVAGVNTVQATLLVLIANRQTVGPEVEPITELRDLAIGDLEIEVMSAVDEVRDVAANVRQMAKDPLGSALPALAAPLAGVIMRSLHKSRKS